MTQMMIAHLTGGYLMLAVQSFGEGNEEAAALVAELRNHLD